MHSSPYYPIVLPQGKLDEKLEQLDGYYQSECGDPICSQSLKASFEGQSSDPDIEYWWYKRKSDSKMMAAWSYHRKTLVKQARTVIDDSGQSYTVDVMRFSLLIDEV